MSLNDAVTAAFKKHSAKFAPKPKAKVEPKKETKAEPKKSSGFKMPNLNGDGYGAKVAKAIMAARASNKSKAA